MLRLDEYIQPLLAQGYRQVRDVTQLPWEDMEDIGIVKLGHQKKLLLAIKRIKDIVSGKWIAPGIANSPQVSQNVHPIFIFFSGFLLFFLSAIRADYFT